MPLKKTKAKILSIVGEYDVELMTLVELRMYIDALKEEHNRMRRARNLYHKEKNELLNFLKCVQEQVLDRKKLAIRKNVEKQGVIHDFEQKEKYEDQINKVTELDHQEKHQRQLFDSFVKVKIAEMFHREEEYEIRKDIVEKDREIHHMEYMHKLMQVELEEKSTELSINAKINFEFILINYVKKMQENLEEFCKIKIGALQDILEKPVDKNDSSFADFLKKMFEYFKGIYWKNIKATNELMSIRAVLNKELNSLTHNLREIIEENEKLKINTVEPVSPCHSEYKTPTFSSNALRTLEQVAYENGLLTVKLDALNKEFNKLKMQFMAAVRKIYQNADFKSLVLERKLMALQDDSEGAACSL